MSGESNTRGATILLVLCCSYYVFMLYYIVFVCTVNVGNHFCREASIAGYAFAQPLCVKTKIDNQVLRKVKIAVESDVKNWAYIGLR